MTRLRRLANPALALGVVWLALARAVEAAARVENISRVPPKPLWRRPAQRDSIVMLASAVANARCVAHAPVARVAKTHRSRVAQPLRAVGAGESSATSSGEASEGPAPPALDSEVRRSRRVRDAREATRARSDAEGRRGDASRDRARS